MTAEARWPWEQIFILDTTFLLLPRGPAVPLVYKVKTGIWYLSAQQSFPPANRSFYVLIGFYILRL